jgi:hypothetical protein
MRSRTWTTGFLVWASGTEAKHQSNEACSGGTSQCRGCTTGWDPLACSMIWPCCTLTGPTLPLPAKSYIRFSDISLLSKVVGTFHRLTMRRQARAWKKRKNGDEGYSCSALPSKTRTSSFTMFAFISRARNGVATRWYQRRPSLQKKIKVATLHCHCNSGMIPTNPTSLCGNI